MIEKTLYIGDVHGDFEGMEALAKFVLSEHRDVLRIVVVGDFGFYPNYSKASWYLKSSLSIPVCFLDGNHENHVMLNHDVCLPPTKKSPCFDALHISRGWVENNILYVGGARTMRRGRLIPGFDHFPEEEIRMSHCIRALDAIENSNINVMVSHDVPESAIQNILRSPPLADQSRGILERLFTAAAPRLVVSGHHHRHRMFEHRDASFV